MTGHEFEPKHLPVLVNSDSFTIYEQDRCVTGGSIVFDEGTITINGRALPADVVERGWCVVDRTGAWVG